MKTEYDIFDFFMSVPPIQAICMTLIIIVLILAIFTDFFNNIKFKNKR